jgi:hypothetical protein
MLSPMADTGNQRTLALVPPLVEGPSAEARFAEAIARALGDCRRSGGASDRSDPRLTLHLLASAALAFNKLDDDQACTAVLALREAIVSAGDVNPHTEPVPLVLRDRRSALVNLLDYLDDLLERVAARAGDPSGGRTMLLGRAIILLAC